MREDGTVKVLDFGLAKAFDVSAGAREHDPAYALSQSPTLSVAGTRMGMILGTAAYMAPEQAKGKLVDKRADIWAFGCVFYEMLAGQQAFQGDDIAEILAAVIKSGANLDLLPAGINPKVRELLARCLEKDFRKRFRDIGDVRYELDEIQTDPSGTLTQPAAGVLHAPEKRVLPWVAAAVALTAVIAGAAVWSLKPAPPQESRPTARFSYTLPQNQTFRNTGRPVVAVSPNGRQFVYNVGSGLYLRSMDGLNARLIPGTEEDLTNPFFSPDGQWIGFWSRGDSQLKKVPVAGGTAVALSTATNPFGASWGADNTILFGQPEGIMRVSANGNTPERLVATEKDEQVDGPQLLPGGQWVLFSLTRGGSRWDVAEIVAQSLASGERKVLWRGGSDARYVPTGHLIYALDDALFALPLDLARLEVSGGPVLLLDGLQRAPDVQTATAHYGVSDGGALVHVVGTSTAAQARTLVWVDRSGREEAIAAPPRAYMSPRISPDGTQVAIDVREQGNDIWIWSLARQTLTRLTFDPRADRSPMWTPDGRRIVFSSSRAGSPNLFWQTADGTGAAERLTESTNFHYPSSISVDGTRLLFEEGPGNVQALTLAGDHPSTTSTDSGQARSGRGEPVEPRRVTSLITTTFAERNGDLSRDGRWVAYESNESGRNEVYVRPFPGVDGGRWQVSTGGGTQPLWAPNSRELFFVDPEGRIVAVPVQAGPGFVAGNPKVIVDGPFATIVPGFNGRMYDLSPDGQHFLMVKAGAGAEQAAPPAQIIVVQNWFEELKRLAPPN